MKTRFILMTMFAAMALSCAKENLPENNVADNVETALVPMEFVAGFESKAAIVDGEKTVEWVAGDQICVFDNLGGDNVFQTEGSGKTVSFTGQVTDGSEEFYALYPYRSAAEFEAETKVVTSKLFPDQKAVLGSYAMAEGGAVMAAKVSEGNVLSFKNMTSHIRFTLAEDLEDVISITLMGNKGEALAGLYTVDFNGETPALTISKPETYVTLRNEDGSALTPGDYFFTILPVEFTEGFTVILSMTDGSQLAKKTTKSITSLGERNQVLPMAKLAASDYKSHMNYFVLYNDGFEVTIGGFTFDNTTLPGGRLVGEGASIAEDGLYFIPTSTSAVKTGYNHCKNLYIFGTDPAVRSKFTLANVLQPQSDPEGCVFLAGLEILNPEGKKRIFEQPSDAAFQFDKFGSLIIKNCKISSIVQHVCHFANKAATLDTFVLENCDYLITGTEANAFVVNTNKMASTINNIIIKNNVFHNIKKGSSLTDFKFVNAPSASIVNVTAVQNTLSSAVTKASGYINAASMSGVANVYDNIYVESHAPKTLTYILNAPVYASTFACTVQNNFFYVTNAEKALQAGSNLPETVDGVIKYGRPRPLTMNPLDDDNWNPAEGRFGYKANLQFYKELNKTEIEGDVPANCGAQRGTAEAANYAARGYSSVNLGNY